tara:strand:+ start:14280 stop:14924 length:645 start_codon:yes stop_codon:yes gene_type:complete
MISKVLLVILLLVVLILGGYVGYKYYKIVFVDNGEDVVDIDDSLNTGMLSHNHIETPLSQEMIHDSNEVFHVSGTPVPYSKAEQVCKQYNAELATYDQLVHAYQHGAEWCNYGWSKEQLGLYPTQKKTWKQIQKGKKEERDMCGHYGINGGKFDENMKFGVNCYGERPNQTNDYEHPELPKDVITKKSGPKPIPDLSVVPYNRVRWQRDLYPVS